MTTLGEAQMGLTWSGKWHIIDQNNSKGRYEIALCGAYLERNDQPHYPDHLRQIKDGARKSTGTCKSCLRSAGVRAITVELPKPTYTKAATDDENGYHSWEYPGGEVIVYDGGTVEQHRFHQQAGGSDLRKSAAAMLAAAELAEKLIGQGDK